MSVHPPISPLEANGDDDYEEDSFGDDDGEVFFRVGDIVRTSQGKLAVVRYKGEVDGMSANAQDEMLGLEILLEPGERGQGHDGSFNGAQYFECQVHRTGVFVAPNDTIKLAPEELAQQLKKSKQDNDKMNRKMRNLEKKVAVTRSRGGKSTPNTPTPPTTREQQEEVRRLKRENARLEEELDRTKRFKSPERTFEGDLRVVEEKLQRAKTRIKELERNEKKQFGRFSGDSERLRQQNTHLKHQNDRLKRDRISLRQKTSELEKQLEAARQRTGPRSRRNSRHMETLEAQVDKLTTEMQQTKAHAKDQEAENRELARQLRRAENVAGVEARKRALQETEEHETEMLRMKAELRRLRMENKRLKRQRDEIEELSRRTKAHQRKQIIHARRERDQLKQQQRRRKRAEIGESSDALQVQLNKVQERLKKKDNNLTSRLGQIQRLSEHIQALETRLDDVNRRASVSQRVDAQMLEEYASIEEKFDQVLGELDEHAEALHSGGLASTEDGRSPQEVLEDNEKLEMQLRQAREENKALEAEIADLKRQLEMSSNERIEELQSEIRVLRHRGDQPVELEEEKTGDEYTLSGNIARILDKRGPLSPDEVEKLREHLRVLRQRFGALVEAERHLSPQKLREAKTALEKAQNERSPNFGAAIDESRDIAVDLKDRHDDLNSFRITAESDLQTNPSIVDPEMLEAQRMTTQDMRLDVDEAFKKTDQQLEEAELRVAEARKLNIQVQQAVDIFALQSGNDDVTDELASLSIQTQHMEEQAEEQLLKIRESRMTLVHTSMNAADTENALRSLEAGKPLTDENVFDAVMMKRVESLNLVNETPAIHLSGLTEFDPPELITEAIEAIRTFKEDVNRQWDSSYELDDEAHRRKMADLDKLQNAYEDMAERQEGRLPQLPEGRTLFPEQVPSPFGLQVLQTLEDAFNEFENEQIVQRHTFEYKRDVDEYNQRLDEIGQQIDDPKFEPRRYFREEDDQRPRGYFEALTPLDKELADIRQQMQYKRKGMEYKQFRSIPMQHRRLDRVDEILGSFQDCPNEMVKEHLVDYQNRLEVARVQIDDDGETLNERVREVEQVLERVNEMIRRRMNLEQTQRAPTLMATDVFGSPPQHTLADLQHQMESLRVALEVNNEFVSRARDDLMDIGDTVEKYEDEVHNRDVDGGRASEIHDELDDCHDLLNLHERSLNDKAKETLSHGQSLLEISNELQKHETLTRIREQNGENVEEDERAIVPLQEAFGDVRGLYEENERALNENQLNALTYANSVYNLKRFLRDSFNAPILTEEEYEDMRMHQVKKHYQDPITQQMSQLTRFDSEEDLRAAIARIDAMRAFLDPNVADGLTGDLDEHLQSSIAELEELRQYFNKLAKDKLTDPNFEPEDYVLEERYHTPIAKAVATNTNQHSNVEQIRQAEEDAAERIQELSDVRQTLRAIRELRQLRSAYSAMVGTVGKDPHDVLGSRFQTEIARLMANVDVNDEEQLEQQLTQIDQCLDWLEAKEAGDLERVNSGVVQRELVELDDSEVPTAKSELEELREILRKEWRAKNAEKDLRLMNARLVLHQRSETVVESGFEDSRKIMSVSEDGVQRINQESLETTHARQYSNLSSLADPQELVAAVHRIDQEIEERRKDVLPDTYELCQVMLSHRGLENAGEEGLQDIAQIEDLPADRKVGLGKELEELRDEYITYYRRRLSPEKQVELLEQQLAASKRQKQQIEERLDPNGPRTDTEVAGLIQPAPTEGFASTNLVINQRAMAVEEKIAEHNPLEDENRTLRAQLDNTAREMDDLRRQLAERPTGETWEDEEKANLAGARPRPYSTQTVVDSHHGPGFSTHEIIDPLAFKPALAAARSDAGKRRSSVMSDQRERYEKPDIGRAIVRGNFFKKKVYFEVRVPGEDRVVERSLKHFQQLRSILDRFFYSKGETNRVEIPTVIQAPPAALWKSGMLTQAKVDLRKFLVDCCHVSEIRRHQAYRSFTSNSIEDWKSYVKTLSQE